MIDFQNKNIFNLLSESEFGDIAIDIFKYQYKNNIVYKQFVDYLNVDYKKINTVEQIPFLPIEFFKTHKVISGSNNAKITFLSSGTTNLNRSKHHITDLEIYRNSFTKGFEFFYGNISDYCILGLLPNYLENKSSSLIYMMEDLIKLSNCNKSGFYLNNYEELYNTILDLKKLNKKYILIGVSYALIDFANLFKIDLSDGILMETGGMKGKRKELTKSELHSFFKESFNVSNVHSEYGMTELLSQSYSKGEGIFECPPWMKILIRDTYDPLSDIGTGRTGGINVIDFANFNSCSFIATKDLGKLHENGRFEVLGRFDDSDIRGCNLLVDS
ncbi:MAG: acyltransferase [Bacteroidales bacterium]|nr:acyltransferase [Bacteroidales bacterium]MBN2758780.1 acyltransferase [Bacteroidales bacterium]